MKTRSWPFVLCLPPLFVALCVLASYGSGPVLSVLEPMPLALQGIAPEQFLRTDSQGIPRVCGYTGQASPPEQGKSMSPLSTTALPAKTRAWEPMPGVIRDDGISACRLEVNVNGQVQSVGLQLSDNVRAASPTNWLWLHDDGLDDDRVAGDYIFTSEPISYNTRYSLPKFYLSDTNSPPGLACITIGMVKIHELDGTTNDFLISPMVGVLSTNHPLTAWRVLASNIVATPHLINISTPGQNTQLGLRNLPFNLPAVTTQIYTVLPDLFDFLMCFSTDHVESIPKTTRANYNAGVHYSVQVNYYGTGQSLYNNASRYGSAGKLLSFNILDAFDRGLLSENATHELMHQWAAYLSSSLGLKEDSGHYNPRSSTASLVGGFQFVPTTNGLFMMNCDEGRSRAHHAPPLDKYLMGLIEGTNVPPLYTYSATNPWPVQICGQIIPGIERSVTIAEIQQLHGTRYPGPSYAQRHFALGFIAESHSRLLEPIELTFYELLAAYYTKPVPVDSPAPYMANNWAPLSRFFEEGTTWTSHLDPVIRPVLTRLQLLPNQTLQITATGFPSLCYSLEVSTNLLTWTSLTNKAAANDGSYEHIAPAPDSAQKFYRLIAW